jgi:hypothetical protein
VALWDAMVSAGCTEGFWLAHGDNRTNLWGTSDGLSVASGGWRASPSPSFLKLLLSKTLGDCLIT